MEESCTLPFSPARHVIKHVELRVGEVRVVKFPGTSVPGYLRAMPKDKNGDPIAPGFQQVKVDGVPGIRLVNFCGKWNKK